MRRITSGGIAFGALGMALLLAGCAAKQPVLYPNAHLQTVGSEQAQSDVIACQELAHEFGVGPGAGKAGRVAGRTAGGAAIGGATGAVAGAIVGGAGRGAAAGAAAGATGGFLTGIFGRSEPDPVYRRFVERCLRERGYATIGWR